METACDILAAKKCVPCEGGIPPLTAEQASELAKAVPEWRITADGKRIGRDWVAKHFPAALAFLNAVGAVAEEEQHHPDLHLESYRNVRIEIWTHAVGGLTENDFVLAAKIDRLPIAVKKSG